MANTNIPLSVQGVDVVNPLLYVAQRAQQKKQEDAQAQQLAGQNELRDLQKQEIEKKLKQLPPEQLAAGLQSVAVNSLALEKLWAAKDYESGLMVAQDIKATTDSLGMPGQEIDNFMKLAQQNPDKAGMYLSQAMMPVVKQNLPKVFADVKNAQGQVVAQRDERTNQLTDVPKALAPESAGTQPKASAMTKAYPNGIFMMGKDDGSVSVVDASSGKELQGDERSLAVKAAMESEIDLAGGKSEARTRSTGSEKRLQETINDGVASAQGAATLYRAMELIDSVETGGIDAAQIKAKQLFGVEGADEGELSANLGQAVLTQLRPTFGSQFTEGEGKRLEKISAGLGRNSETNKRIIRSMIDIMERDAKRAIGAARYSEDDRAAADIESLLNYRVSTGISLPSKARAAGITDSEWNTLGANEKNEIIAAFPE